MAPAHRILVDHADFEPGQTLKIEADEARHAARVKRLRPGDALELLNGRGGIAQATLEEIARDRSGPVLLLRITEAATLPPLSPRLTVLAATPKAARADELVDALSQVGAAAWRPLSAARTVVDPRPTKLDRLTRIAAEAAKQSGRPWLLRIGPSITLEQALAEAHTRDVVLADASGDPYQPSGAEEIHLLIGPEGGFEPRELEQARRAGVRMHSFGPHIMRIETAAVAAAAIILNAERSAAAATSTSHAGNDLTDTRTA